MSREGDVSGPPYMRPVTVKSIAIVNRV